jgi:TonB family protein
MVTVRSARAWALAIAIFGLAAPFVHATRSASDRRQSVVAKPIDPSAVQPPTDTEAVDLTPLPPGVYRAGNGVSMPRVVGQVQANYTSDAMFAQVHGIVRLVCTVGVDGTVKDVRIVRSLDTLHGVDDEAVRALKLWTFEPGEKDGVLVPVQITVESIFSMSTVVRPTKTSR